MRGTRGMRFWNLSWKKGSKPPKNFLAFFYWVIVPTKHRGDQQSPLFAYHASPSVIIASRQVSPAEFCVLNLYVSPSREPNTAMVSP